MKSQNILIFALILAAITTGCSSTSEKNVNRKNASDGAPLADDYTWVDSLDFKTTEEKKYQPDRDQFKGEVSEADALSKESIARLPKPKLQDVNQNSNDPLDKIVSYCYQDQFDAGFKLADEVYGQYKNNTSYWNQVGTCYFLKSEYSKAILFFNKSRDLDPKYNPPVNNLGVVYQAQGKYQKALLAYKKAADLNTFALTPLYNLAQLYLKYGKVEQAHAILEALHRKKPLDVDVASGYATSLMMKGMLKESVELFAKLDKATLSEARVGLNFALALKLHERPQDALTVLQNVSEPKESDLRAYYQRVNEFIRK